MSAAAAESTGNELLDMALRYARYGFPVFPCHTPTSGGRCSCGDPACDNQGKHPRTPNGFTNASTDPDIIRGWWSRWEDANIGLRTGPWLVVLDVDDPAQLEHLPELPPTLITQTGRDGGGRHYWFTAPDGADVTNRRGQLPTDVDIRGAGGYIIAPPSLHKSGRRYAPVERNAIAELPAAVLELVTPPQRAPAEHRQAPDWKDADGTAYARRALDLEAAAVANTTEGGRNDRLNEAAYNLGQLVAGGELAEAAAVAALEHAAAACGLPDREAAATITSGLEAGKRNPRTAPERPGHATPTPLHQQAGTQPPGSGDQKYSDSHPDPMPDRASSDDAPPAAPPVDTTGELAGAWPDTDLGNAERLVHYHGRNLRYVATWKAWLVWNGKRWERDTSGQAIRWAKDTVRQIFHEAAGQPDSEKRKRIAAWSFKSESRPRIEAMLALAESEAGIPIEPADLDANPYLLNTPSGTVDLRTGTLQQHDRQDLITKLAPVPYDAAAAGGEFYTAFLDRIFGGDQDLVSFVQRLAGLSILGTTSERMLPICHGAGANGKSTLLELWSRVVGDYADQADADTLLLAKREQGANTPELADLQGKRLIVTSETSEGRKMNVARVKSITGGDTIKACRKFENPFSFIPSHTVWLATNHRPRISDPGDAIWDRVHLIPFAVTFPVGERVPRVELDERLDQDAEAVLAWLVQGAAAYHRDGVGTVPPSVAIATDAYRESEDVVGLFLEDATEQSVTSSTPSRVLYQAYRSWCEQHGEQPQRERDFGPRVESKGYEKKRTSAGVAWLNLALRDRT